MRTTKLKIQYFIFCLLLFLSFWQTAFCKDTLITCTYTCECKSPMWKNIICNKILFTTSVYVHVRQRCLMSVDPSELRDKVCLRLFRGFQCAWLRGHRLEEAADTACTTCQKNIQQSNVSSSAQQSLMQKRTGNLCCHWKLLKSVLNS